MLLQKTLAPLYRPPPTFEFWILVKRAQLFFSLPISLSLKQLYDCRVQRSRIKFSFLVSFSLKKNCKNYQTFAQNSPVPCQAPNVSGMNKNQIIPKLPIRISTNFFDKWEKVFSYFNFIIFSSKTIMKILNS